MFSHNIIHQLFPKFAFFIEIAWSKKMPCSEEGEKFLSVIAKLSPSSGDFLYEEFMKTMKSSLV